MYVDRWKICPLMKAFYELNEKLLKKKKNGMAKFRICISVRVIFCPEMNAVIDEELMEK